MAILAIRGHKERGKEVIEILKMLGGKDVGYSCNCLQYYYYIDGYDNIAGTTELPESKTFVTYTLEEFLEKFPYKVGDRVKKANDNDGYCATVISMDWNNGISEVVYTIIFDDHIGSTLECLSVNLQPYKEETMDKVNKAVFDANAHCCDIMNDLIKEKTMEEIKIDIPKGYEFAGVDDDKQQVVFTKIQPEYPKTYEECCKVLGYSGNYNMILTTDVDNKLFDALYRLKVCRDAYWKLYREQMGWGKLWKQDYNDRCFIIANNNGNIHTYEYHGSNNVILAFPTEEMRDAFYEKFKELIETVKELL